jgi:hypothetical protein
MSNIYIHILNDEEIAVFVNTTTGTASWTLPNVDKSSILFISHISDDTGLSYYEFVNDNSTTWELPEKNLSSIASSIAKQLEIMSNSECAKLIKSPFNMEVSCLQQDLMEDLIDDGLLNNSTNKESLASYMLTLNNNTNSTNSTNTSTNTNSTNTNNNAINSFIDIDNDNNNNSFLTGNCEWNDEEDEDNNEDNNKDDEEIEERSSIALSNTNTYDDIEDDDEIYDGGGRNSEFYNFDEDEDDNASSVINVSNKIQTINSLQEENFKVIVLYLV